MAWKSVIIIIMALCFFVSSCYPELSVQKYDKLKEDLIELDEQRNDLQEQLENVTAELEEIKNKNTEVKAYIDFLDKIVSTQNSESLLLGEFDTESLFEAKEFLMESAEILKDNDIIYYISLIDEENEDKAMGIYYKTIEECLKGIKQELAVNNNKS